MSDSARVTAIDAINDLRVGECRTSMGCVIDLALRRMPKPSKPVLDHFSYDRSIPDWPDAAQWS